MYYIYNIKLNAWFGNNNPYTSSFADAREYTHEAAVRTCKKHHDVQSGMGAVMIAKADVMEVLNK